MPSPPITCNVSDQSEQDILRLSHRPAPFINGMISTSDPPSPSTMARKSCSSSLGRLAMLPVELLHQFMTTLDFKCLSRLSRVSLQGLETVNSLPAYRDMMKHAPHTLTALGRTQTINLHSASTIYNALRAEECISCGDYGAFLFLPTCERCCYECLAGNQSLWMITLPIARTAFSLTIAQSKRLPAMRSIPGKYWVKHSISRKRPQKLVSVKAAKELALKFYGTSESLARTIDCQRYGCFSEKDYRMYRFLQNAPLQPLRGDLSRRRSEGNTPNDSCCGMASIPFQSLRNNGTLERALWCRGCHETFEHYQQMSPRMLAEIVPPGRDAFRVLLAMQRRAMSKAQFLDHVTQCPGVQRFVSRVQGNG